MILNINKGDIIIVKIMNGSLSRNIKLHFSTDSTITDELYDELFDMTYNGIEIETVDDEIPYFCRTNI